MLKVSKAVEKIVKNNPLIIHAIKENHLNLTSYAKSIKKEVEILTLKEVKIGTIVVALSRLSTNLVKSDSKNVITIKNINLKTEIIEVTFERNSKTFEIIKNIDENINTKIDDFFILTQGITEITIIFSNNLKTKILNTFNKDLPKNKIEGLAAITIKMTSDIVSERDVFYKILHSFSINEINIIEIVSTYTEFTVIVKEIDASKTIETINNYFIKNR